MRKKILLIPLALLLAVSLVATGCPAPPVEVPAEIAELEKEVAAEKAKVTELEAEIAELKAPVEVYEWRFQHTWGAVDSHLFEDYAARVREMSDGRIDMSIFCNDELVPRADVPVALVEGLLDIAWFNPVHHMGTIPAGEVESVPFLWRSLDDFISIHYEMGLENEYRKLFRDTLDVHLIAILPDDLAGMLWMDNFSTLADLKGRKINLWGAAATVFSQFGIVPTWIDVADLYTSLATGLIDGVSWGGAKSMMDYGFPEVAKYWMLPYYQITWTPGIWKSVEKWEALPSDLQSILRQTSYSWAFQYLRNYFAAGDTMALAQAAEQWGTEVVTLPEEDVQKLLVASVDYLLTIKEEHPEATDVVDIVFNALETFGYID